MSNLDKPNPYGSGDDDVNGAGTSYGSGEGSGDGYGDGSGEG